MKNYSDNIIASNRKIEHYYHIIERFTAGLVLEGWEVKSIRNGSVSIDGSYIYFEDNEIYIFGMKISSFQYKNNKKNIEKNKWKLLLKKREIKNIISDIKLKKILVIPIKIFSKNRWIKLEISTSKRLKKYQIKKDDKLKNEFRRKEKKNFFFEDI